MARSKELAPTMRARICELHAIGWGYRKIHKRYPEIALSTISYTIRAQSKRDDQASRPRCGRPPMISGADEVRLRELIAQDPNLNLRQLSDALPSAPSKQTVRRLLRKWKAEAPEVSGNERSSASAAGMSTETQHPGQSVVAVGLGGEVVSGAGSVAPPPPLPPPPATATAVAGQAGMESSSMGLDGSVGVELDQGVPAGNDSIVESISHTNPTEPTTA